MFSRKIRAARCERASSRRRDSRRLGRFGIRLEIVDRGVVEEVIDPAGQPGEPRGRDAWG